jgi:APA family basic amino acid/polyamine antiporter
VLYALGDEGLAPPLRRVDRRGTPMTALAISTVATMLIVATGTVDFVIALAAFFFVTNYALSFLSVFVLRRREPDTPRPYRAWGYPWTTGIVLLGSIAFLAAAIAADRRNAILSLLLLAASIPTFLLLRKARG